VVENNRFTQIGRKAVDIPAGATRVDLTGKTVMQRLSMCTAPRFPRRVTGKMSKANLTRENYIDHCSATPTTVSPRC